MGIDAGGGTSAWGWRLGRSARPFVIRRYGYRWMILFSRERVGPYVSQSVAARRETGKIGALTISVASG
jgi:hypothetical protein